MEFKRIESKDNELIKKIAKLSQKKYRDEIGLFVVENFKIFFDCSEISPEYLFLTDEFYRKYFTKLDRRLDEKIILVFPEIIDKMSTLESNAGFLAVYQKRDYKIDFSKPTIYLNGVSDPGNLGTILRSAVAFDFANVVTDENCADIYGNKTVQAAKDAIFKLNFGMDKQCAFLNEIKKRKISIIGADISDKSEVLKNFSFPQNFCLILGSEANGLTDESAKFVEEKIMIPISKNMESLNVAVSAGIIFYEINSAKEK
ncbi:MAG: RNA methyltransferase [Patescibacteria group bacterium]